VNSQERSSRDAVKHWKRIVENALGTVTVWYIHVHALKTKETL